MKPSIPLRKVSRGLARRLLHDERAAQLVEFAVSLPLLIVFVVGIFDFSGAFTLKQKLTNVARDAARAAAADPASDLGNASPPMSVVDAFRIVDNYLAANQINDCGLTPSLGTSSQLTWTFTVSPTSSAPCGITLIINRGYYFPANGSGAAPALTCSPQSPGLQTAVVGTCVSIQYSYPWRFGRVASLLGSTATLPAQISAVGVALNEN